MAGCLRRLPQVQRLLELPGALHLLERHPRQAVVEALRRALDDVRQALREGGSAAVAAPPEPDALLHRARTALDAAGSPVLRRVINATGIVLHTNLGRAPLPEAAVAAVADAARGYCNLEFDLATGGRGHRTQGIEPLLRQVTGADAGIAVNNCAAAVLLALSALASGGEVIVSRGELVEIGGGFRIPDVIRQGGARLVEVGTTNKTRLPDYRQAITPDTRVLLKVHRSNFRIHGFTEETPLAELAALARERDLLLVQDLGSGALVDLRRLGRPHAEATVQDSVAAGAHVVAFSGDKLLGGPQAGLLVGRAAAIDPMRRHPLMRALRLDKLVLAALEAALRLHRDGATEAIPALRMLGQTPDALCARAERLAALLAAPAPDTAPIQAPVHTQVEATLGYAGGGTLPDEGVPSAALALAVPAPENLAAHLRAGRPAVVGRIADGRLLLDMLTVEDADLPDLAEAIRQAAATAVAGSRPA